MTNECFSTEGLPCFELGWRLIELRRIFKRSKQSANELGIGVYTDVVIIKEISGQFQTPKTARIGPNFV